MNFHFDYPFIKSDEIKYKTFLVTLRKKAKQKKPPKLPQEGGCSLPRTWSMSGIAAKTLMLG